LRTITRELSGQLRRSISLVTSATKTPGRLLASSSTAGRQAEGRSETIASRISAVTEKPKLKPTPACRHALAKRWVAPAESDLTT
jgi:hypothetical protein